MGVRPPERAGMKPALRRSGNARTFELSNFRTIFLAACEKRGSLQSPIVLKLIEAFCEAVESGRSLSAPFEVRSKGD